jgi:hypothetical protein
MESSAVTAGVVSRVADDPAQLSFEELPEIFWRDGFLAMGGQIKVFECSEKGLDGGSQDFLVFKVEGAEFETFPKRQSHVACGFLHSGRW